MIAFRRTVYLDNNATTPVSPRVRRRMDRVLSSVYGNPSSLYREARDAAGVLDESRQAVAAAVGAKPEEILFTGSATEANNTVLVGLAERFLPKKKKIVSLPIEHASVMGTLEYLRGRGAKVELCPVDTRGFAQLDRLDQLVDADTFLVCCMLANNETGTIQDVAEASRLAHAKGALVLSDCVQAAGKVPVDVKALGVDYATFSAHKLHGPKGAGALYAREGAPLAPFVHGGHQEGGLRAGTEGLHNIAGMAEAFRGAGEMLSRAGRVARLRERLIAGLRAIKPDITVNSPKENCLPNTASVSFPGMANSVLMAHLDFYGIAVSAGSACNTQSDEPSHVLSAMGLSPEQARQTVRFSLSDRTTERDVDYALSAVRDFVQGRGPRVTAVAPGQLDENLLFDPGTYILDVRFWHDRKMLMGLPNSHQASFVFISRYLSKIPRDRNVLAVCQAGANAPVVAYYLRSRGFSRVSFLMTGLAGWKAVHPELYRKHAGHNVTSIEP
jgi:cysteine desulfurase